MFTRRLLFIFNVVLPFIGGALALLVTSHRLGESVWLMAGAGAWLLTCIAVVSFIVWARRKPTLRFEGTGAVTRSSLVARIGWMRLWAGAPVNVLEARISELAVALEIDHDTVAEVLRTETWNEWAAHRLREHSYVKRSWRQFHERRTGYEGIIIRVPIEPPKSVNLFKLKERPC
jgi:hypothetical protein